MLVTRYSLNPLRPAFEPEIAERSSRPVALPVGGQIDAGTEFAKGTVLGCVGGDPTDEVWTLAIAGATGTVTFYFTTPAGIVSTTFAIDATTAVVETALEAIFGEDNVEVTGTPGTEYTITFANDLSERLMGGKVTLTATTGTPTLTRTTPGSAGAGQYDAYDNSSPAVARCLLKYAYGADPTGGRVTESGTTGQPSEASAYFAGYFFVADLTGLDSSAMSDPGFRLVEGAAITDDGAVIGLGV
jgi:hypothetical protein